jgi:hypothetical protein
MTVDEWGARYELRYCAFIDILGFTHLVTRIGDDVPLRSVLRILSELRSPLSPGEDADAINFEMTSISDAIVISTAANPAGLFYLLLAIHELTLNVLRQGYFTRGAIVSGLLHHDGSTVVGDGLLRAIQFEREIVRYPRVLVIQDVARAFEQSYNETDFLRESDDGPTFLHVLRPYADAADVTWASRADVTDTVSCDAIRARIVQRFDESRDNPRHFEKVQWFVRYWNDVCSEGKMECMKPIDRPDFGVPTFADVVHKPSC